MLSLGISRGFAFVDFYHLQDATRWMETNQVASQSPSLVLILEIWKINPNGNQSSVETVQMFESKSLKVCDLKRLPC